MSVYLDVPLFTIYNETINLRAVVLYQCTSSILGNFMLFSYFFPSYQIMVLSSAKV